MYEVDLQGEVVHLKTIDEPELPTKTSDITADGGQGQLPSPPDPVSESSEKETATCVPTNEVTKVNQSGSAPSLTTDDEPWPTKFTETLTPFLSESAMEKLKDMFLQGPEPPFVSDNGWGDRQSQAGDGTKGQDVTAEASVSTTSNLQSERGKGGKRGRRGRDKSGRGRGGKDSRGGREDNRKVLSDVRIQSTSQVIFLYVTSDCLPRLANSIETRTDYTPRDYTYTFPGQTGDRNRPQWSRK